MYSLNRILRSKINNSKVLKATLIHQLSVLTNIGLGLVLIPFIFRSFGSDGLAIYLELIALKAIVEIFTSTFGGGIVRAIIDGGGDKAYGASIRLFSSYSLVAVLVSYLYFEYFGSPGTWSEVYFYVFLAANILLQPALQRATANGFQHVPPLVRILNNTLQFGCIVVYIVLSDQKTISAIFLFLATSSLLCLLIVMLWSKGVKSTIVSSENFKVLELTKTASSYAIFAVFLAASSQIEIIVLGKYIATDVFAVIIAAWKIPNIIIQLLWRYCEVNGVALKIAGSKGGSAAEFIKKRSVESVLLVVSLLVGVSYFMLGKMVYTLWMGEGFKVSNELVMVFSIGIVPLVINRFYTAYLQFTSFSYVLAAQYFIICVSKIIYILFFLNFGVYGSFVVWFFLEFIFGLYNRKKVKEYL